MNKTEMIAEMAKDYIAVLESLKPEELIDEMAKHYIAELECLNPDKLKYQFDMMRHIKAALSDADWRELHQASMGDPKPFCNLTE